jgi:Tol biopolymer transport system component
MIKPWSRALCVAAALCCASAAAEELVVDIRQGTNMAIALSPDRETVVTNLLGGLWRLPASGGGAIPLLAAGQGYYQPRFSPDGSAVVLQRFQNEQWDLWLYDIAAGSERPLTATPHDERQPEFSADGTSIVYASNEAGAYALWTLNLGTGAVTRLTNERGDNFYPAVSEQGDIAYVNRTDGVWTLRQLPAGGGPSAELLRSQSILSAPSWRPGAGVILVQERDGIRASRLKMLLLADEPVVKVLTKDEDIFDSRPAWISPAEYMYTADGQIWRRTIAGFEREPVHLFAALSLDTTTPQAPEVVLDARGPQAVIGITGLTASGDQRQLAFAALGDIWLSQRRGPTQLTDDAFVDIDPTFSPDASKIIFASDRAGTLDLWQISLDNGAREQLTAENGKAFQPVFGPRGRFVAYLESDGLMPSAATRVRLLDLEGNSETNVLGGELYDVGQLRWATVGSEPRIVVDARVSPSATRQTLTFDLGGNLLPGDASSAGPDAVDANEVPRGAPLEWTNAAAVEPYVIQVGRLFDGVRGTYMRHVDIHIEGQRIAAIVGRGVRPLPERVIDARDATVIPGLIDVRAHQSWLSGERLGRSWLAYGVTSVRELAVDLPAATARAETWASGRQTGPRLFIEPAHGMPMRGTSTTPWMSAGTRFRFDPRKPGETPSLRDLGGSPLLRSYQDTLAVLIGSRNFVRTELVVAAGIGPRNRLARADPAYSRLFLPHEQLAWPANAETAAQLRLLQNTLARLVRSGANVVAASDAPNVPYGYGLHIELQLLVDAGIAPDQALRLATARGAMALGLDGELGTLEDGKLADLVVIDGDPLARISDTLNIEAVVRGGRWFDRVELLEPGLRFRAE